MSPAAAPGLEDINLISSEKSLLDGTKVVTVQLVKIVLRLRHRQGVRLSSRSPAQAYLPLMKTLYILGHTSAIRSICLDQ